MPIRVLESGIIEIDIPQSIIDIAQENADTYKVNNGYSILHGKGGIVGHLGELAFMYVFHDAQLKHTTHYDFIWRGMRIDIKSARRNVPPHLTFSASIPAYSVDYQECDGYIFTSVNVDIGKIWIMGGIKKADFINKAIFFNEDDEDPKFPGWRFDCNTYKVDYSMLTQLGDYYLKTLEKLKV